MVMRQLFIALKRHVQPIVMTFFFVLLFPLFSFPVLHAENSGLQQLYDSAESEANLDQLFQLMENLKNNRISLNSLPRRRRCFTSYRGCDCRAASESVALIPVSHRNSNLHSNRSHLFMEVGNDRLRICFTHR